MPNVHSGTHYFFTFIIDLKGRDVDSNFPFTDFLLKCLQQGWDAPEPRACRSTVQVPRDSNPGTPTWHAGVLGNIEPLHQTLASEGFPSPRGRPHPVFSSCRLHTPWRKASCLPVKCTGVVHDQAGCQEPRSHRLTACSHSQPVQVQAAARAGVPTGRAHLVRGAPGEFWVGRPPPYQCLHVESVSGRRNPQRSVRPYRKQTIRPVGRAVPCTVAVS